MDPGRRRSTVLDGCLALATFGCGTAPVLISGTATGPAWAVAGLGAGVAVPLLARRRWPVGVLLAVSAVLAAAALAGVRFTPFVSNAGPAITLAVYTVAATRPRRRSMLWSTGVLLGLGAVTVLALLLHPHQDQDAVQWFLAVPGWLAGDATRARSGYRQELARQRAVRVAEREARVRAEERVRLSREIHDVVSHVLSMIALRSAVGGAVAADDPAEARAALAAIETASRGALEELRSVLRATRDDADLREPVQPTLADLPQLVTPARAAGLDIELDVAPVACPPTLQTTIYRIVQEAITNVVKHADARRVSIEVAGDGAALSVAVTDDGVGRPPDAPDGMGTTGMRERADLFGGALRLGPDSHGRGHRVAATFPLSNGHG